MHFLKHDSSFAHLVAPVPGPAALELSQLVTSEPVDPENIVVLLAYLHPETVEASVDELQTVASRYSPFEVKISEVAKVFTSDGEFLCQCAVVESAKLSNMDAELVDMLGDAVVPERETLFHIPISMSEEPVNTEAVIGYSFLLDELQIRFADDIISATLGGASGVAYYISDNRDDCEGYGVVRTEDEMLMSCHDSEVEAQDALDLLLNKESEERDESLINLTITQGVSMTDESAEIENELTDIESELTEIEEELSNIQDMLDAFKEMSPEDRELALTQLQNLLVEPADEEVIEEATEEMGLGEMVAIEEVTMESTSRLRLAADRQLEALGSRVNGNDFEMVMVLEGVETGDGRFIELGALSHRELPLPFMFNPINTGHEGSRVAGIITGIWRENYDGFNAIMAKGIFDNSPVGEEARRMISDGVMRGVSVDMDDVQVSEELTDGGQISFSKGRIMGVTGLPFQAFPEAGIWITRHDGAAVVASGGIKPEITITTSYGADCLVASGAFEAASLDRPDSAWFEAVPAHDFAYPVQFDEDGSVHGYVAKWGNVHIGFLNKTVGVPHTRCDYAKFRTGKVLCNDGREFATGRLIINTVHPKAAGKAFNEVSAFYDHTGSCVADVTAREDEYGVFVCGAIRPDTTPAQLRIARGSDWSPDWRSIDGNLEMVAILGVNLSGFIVDGLVASGGFASDEEFVVPGETFIDYDLSSGEACSLIGCFRVSNDDTEVGGLKERIEALESFAREIILERVLDL